MERIRKNTITYLIFFIIVIIFFYVFYNDYYVSDAYQIIGDGLEEYNNPLINGRFVEYIIICLVKNINISYLNLYRIFLTISAVLISSSIYIIYKTFKKENDKGITLAIITISVFMIFFNLAMSEMLLFIECLTMSFSIFLSIIASKLYIKKKYIQSFILVLIAALSYQATIIIFIPLVIVLFLKEYKTIKVKEIIKIIIFCYATLGINYILLLIMKFNGVEIERRIESFNLLSCLSYILANFLNYGFVVIIYDCIVILFSKIIPEDKRDIMINVFMISAVSLIANVLITFGSSSLLTYRMMLILFAIPGFTGIYLYNEIENFSNKQKKRLFILQIIISVINIFLFYFNIIVCIEQKSNTNEMAEVIKQEVKEYENESGNIITNISFYIDRNAIYYVYGIPDLAGSANPYYCTWSRIAALKMLLNRDLFESKPHEEIYKYFENKELNENFSKEKLLFENNTLHFFIE